MRRSWQKYLWCAALLCGAGVSPAFGESAFDATFNAAQAEFEKAKTPADYTRAAEQFNVLLASGYQNGAVYFNLGNAYFLAGDYGRAIVAFRKAKFFRPRDPCLDANLRTALSRAGVSDPPLPWWRNILFWSGWFAYPARFRFALAAWVVAVGLATAGLFLRSRRMYLACGALALGAALLSAELSVAYYDLNLSPRAIITVETTALKRDAAGADPAFNRPLKQGEEFTIAERRGDWVRGQFGDTGEGWVERKCVAEFCPQRVIQ
jgi:tetratricopeptide (TPR) repeat protein